MSQLQGYLHTVYGLGVFSKMERKTVEAKETTMYKL